MSDLDELNSDFDEYEPGLDGDLDKTFRIRDPLQPPDAHPFSTADLHGKSMKSDLLRNLIHLAALIHQGVIELNPPYQRGQQDILRTHCSLSQMPFASRRGVARGKTDWSD